jgi:hypothetical protein
MTDAKSLRVVTWDRTGERFYCSCRVYQSICSYIQRLHYSCFTRKWIWMGHIPAVRVWDPHDLQVLRVGVVRRLCVFQVRALCRLRESGSTGSASLLRFNGSNWQVVGLPRAGHGPEQESEPAPSDHSGQSCDSSRLLTAAAGQGAVTAIYS